MNENWLIEDVASAVQQLEAALLLPADNDVVKAGCIQYFEFCFELAWKSVKGTSKNLDFVFPAKAGNQYFQ